MVRGIQYYLIVFNLKKPAIVIIDNDASDEGIPNRYATVPGILVSVCLQSINTKNMSKFF